MDTERLQEIDRKIKRYEGIGTLLSRDLQENDTDAVNLEETDDTASGNQGVNKDERN
jgi:hypothetical protein